MKQFVKYLELLVVMTACLTIGALLGMTYDPNWEYCRPDRPNSRVTVLAPTDPQQDCHYEQSTEGPGIEVCG